MAAETGAKGVSVSEAARNGDVVVVTIPMKNLPKLPRGLFEGTSDNVVVVDTCNYYPQQRDGRIDAIETGTPESRWVEQQVGRPVIKAFNNIYAQHLMERGQPAGTPGRIALPVQGTTRQRRPWCCSLSTNSGSMALMPVGWMNLGDNNLARRSMRRTSTPTACDVR